MAEGFGRNGDASPLKLLASDELRDARGEAESGVEEEEASVPGMATGETSEVAEEEASAGRPLGGETWETAAGPHVLRKDDPALVLSPSATSAAAVAAAAVAAAAVAAAQPSALALKPIARAIGTGGDARGEPVVLSAQVDHWHHQRREQRRGQLRADPAQGLHGMVRTRCSSRQHSSRRGATRYPASSIVVMNGTSWCSDSAIERSTSSPRLPCWISDVK